MKPSSKDAFGDGHGFRFPPKQELPVTGWPSKFKGADGKVHVVSCGLEGFLVELFEDSHRGGVDATNRFYALVQDRTVLFVALYGSDSGIVNNYYRTVQSARR